MICRIKAMQGAVLVVCIGNLCRSPLGERLLRRALPGRAITSAGLAALVGQGADAKAAAIAAEQGVDLGGHVARQLTGEIGAEHALILVMEASHRAEIMQLYPQLGGRVMLFDHWTGAKDIPDPYRNDDRFHRAVRDALTEAAAAWAARLAGARS